MSIIIQKVQVAGGVIYSAWEPRLSALPPAQGRYHHTITFIDGQFYGRIGTDPEPSLFEHLEKGTQARSAAVKQAYAERYAVAYEAIVSAHPELKTKGRRNDGVIEVWGRDT